MESCYQIEQIVKELDEFKDALFDTGECGLSVKELYLTSQKDESFLDLKYLYSNFLFHNIVQIYPLGYKCTTNIPNCRAIEKRSMGLFEFE